MKRNSERVWEEYHEEEIFWKTYSKMEKGWDGYGGNYQSSKASSQSSFLSRLLSIRIDNSPGEENFRTYCIDKSKKTALIALSINFFHILILTVSVPEWQLGSDVKYAIFNHLQVWCILLFICLLYYILLWMEVWTRKESNRSPYTILKWVGMVILFSRLAIHTHAIWRSFLYQTCLLEENSLKVGKYAAFLITEEMYQVFSLSILPLPLPWIISVSFVEGSTQILRVLTCHEQFQAFQNKNSLLLFLSVLIACFYVFIAIIPATKFEISMRSSYCSLSKLKESSKEKKELINALCADIKLPSQQLKALLIDHEKSQQAEDMMSNLSYSIDRLLILLRMNENRYQFAIKDLVYLSDIVDNVSTMVHQSYGWKSLPKERIVFQSSLHYCVTNKDCLEMLLYFALYAISIQSQSERGEDEIEEDEEKIFVRMDPLQCVNSSSSSDIKSMDSFLEIQVYCNPSVAVFPTHDTTASLPIRSPVGPRKTSDLIDYQNCLMACREMIRGLSGKMTVDAMKSKVMFAIPFRAIMSPSTICRSSNKAVANEGLSVSSPSPSIPAIIDHSKITTAHTAIPYEGHSISSPFAENSTQSSSNLTSTATSMGPMEQREDSHSTPTPLPPISFTPALPRHLPVPFASVSVSAPRLYPTTSELELILPDLDEADIKTLCIYSEESHLRYFLVEVASILRNGRDIDLPIFDHLNMVDLFIRRIVIVTSLEVCRLIRRKGYEGFVVLLSDRLAYLDETQLASLDFYLSLPCSLTALSNLIKWIQQSKYDTPIILQDGHNAWSSLSSSSSSTTPIAIRGGGGVGGLANNYGWIATPEASFRVHKHSFSQNGYLKGVRLAIHGLIVSSIHSLRHFIYSWQNMVPAVPSSQLLSFARWLRINPTSSCFHKTAHMDLSILVMFGLLVTMLVGGWAGPPAIILTAIPLMLHFIIRRLPLSTIVYMDWWLYRVYLAHDIFMVIGVTVAAFGQISDIYKGGFHFVHSEEQPQSLEDVMTMRYGQYKGQLLLFSVLSFPIRLGIIYELMRWPYPILPALALLISAAMATRMLIDPIERHSVSNIFIVLLSVVFCSQTAAFIISETTQRGDFEKLRHYLSGRDFLDRCLSIAWRTTRLPLQRLNALQQEMLDSLIKEAIHRTGGEGRVAAAVPAAATVEDTVDAREGSTISVYDEQEEGSEESDVFEIYEPSIPQKEDGLTSERLDKMERICQSLSSTHSLLHYLEVWNELNKDRDGNQYYDPPFPQTNASTISGERNWMLIKRMEMILLPQLFREVCALYAYQSEDLQVVVTMAIDPRIYLIKCDPYWLKMELHHTLSLAKEKILMNSQGGSQEIVLIVRPLLCDLQLKFTDVRRLQVMVWITGTIAPETRCTGREAFPSEKKEHEEVGHEMIKVMDDDHSKYSLEYFQETIGLNIQQKTIVVRDSIYSLYLKHALQLFPSISASQSGLLEQDSCCQPPLLDSRYHHFHQFQVLYRLTNYSHRLSMHFLRDGSQRMMKIHPRWSQVANHWSLFRAYQKRHEVISHPSMPMFLSLTLFSCAKQKALTSKTHGFGLYQLGFHQRSVQISHSLPGPSSFLHADCILIDPTLYQPSSLAGGDGGSGTHGGGANPQFNPSPISSSSHHTLDDGTAIRRDRTYLMDILLYLRAHGYRGIIAVAFTSGTELFECRMMDSQIPCSLTAVTDPFVTSTLVNAFIKLPLIHDDLKALRRLCEDNLIRICLPSC